MRIAEAASEDNERAATPAYPFNRIFPKLASVAVRPVLTLLEVDLWKSKKSFCYEIRTSNRLYTLAEEDYWTYTKVHCQTMQLTLCADIIMIV